MSCYCHIPTQECYNRFCVNFITTDEKCLANDKSEKIGTYTFYYSKYRGNSITIWNVNSHDFGNNAMHSDNSSPTIMVWATIFATSNNLFGITNSIDLCTYIGGQSTSKAESTLWVVLHYKQYMCQETNQKEVDKGVEDEIL
jgi:hypothetical protein